MRKNLISQNLVLKLTIIFSICSSIYLVHFAWKKEIFQYANNQAIFDLGSKIEELDSDSLNENIRSYIDSGNAKGLLDEFEKLEEEIRLMGQYFESENYIQVEEGFVDLRQNFKAMLATSDVGAALRVLHGKTKSFYEFANQNKWRTLSRVSLKLEKLVTPYKIKVKNFYSGKRLRNILRLYEYNIGKMTDITDKSYLSASDKKLVNYRLNSLRKEIGLINEYHRKNISFEKSKGNFLNFYGIWFNEIRPKVAGLKISLIDNSKKFNYIFFIIVVAQLLLFILSFYLRKREKVVLRDQEEKNILSKIRLALVPQRNVKVEFNPQNSEEFDKLKCSIHNRMSFGLMFQEALPFSALLLDDSLNLVWANKLFLESWEISENEIKSGSLTWDQLQKKTNLGENDPVMEAHHNGIAGIYQIQLLTNSSSEAQPFEMYVSPIEHMDSKRLMIFFYPLRSVEETLLNQSKAIVGPVKRTLESFMQGNFREDISDKLEKDYRIAGIGEIFELFKAFQEKVNTQFLSVIAELENVENLNLDQKKEMDELKEENSGLYHSVSMIKEIVLQEKDIVIDLSRRLENISSNLNTLKGKESTGHDKVASLLDQCNHLYEKNLENLEFIDNIKEHKEIVKSNIKVLSQSRQELSQEIDQLNLYIRSTRFGPEKVEESIQKIKMILAENLKYNDLISKQMKLMDVHFSKKSLLEKNQVETSLKSTEEHIEQSYSEITEMIDSLGRSALEIADVNEEQVNLIVEKTRILKSRSSDGESPSVTRN